ncbi:hypothetical protein BH23GEM9_BH23GEM9_02500 [soil metagenome]
MTEADRRPAIAATAADAADPRLRSRTYAVPFEAVWRASLRLAGGGLRGWSTHSADDHDGVIRASASSLLGGEHDIEIRIGLDADAQTVVDATATVRSGRDFGRARRRLQRFLLALDRATAAPRSTAGPQLDRFAR